MNQQQQQQNLICSDDQQELPPISDNPSHKHCNSSVDNAVIASNNNNKNLEKIEKQQQIQNQQEGYRNSINKNQFFPFLHPNPKNNKKSRNNNIIFIFMLDSTNLTQNLTSLAPKHPKPLHITQKPTPQTSALPRSPSFSPCPIDEAKWNKIDTKREGKRRRDMETVEEDMRWLRRSLFPFHDHFPFSLFDLETHHRSRDNMDLAFSLSGGAPPLQRQPRSGDSPSSTLDLAFSLFVCEDEEEEDEHAQRRRKRGHVRIGLMRWLLDWEEFRGVRSNGGCGLEVLNWDVRYLGLGFNVI